MMGHQVKSSPICTKPDLLRDIGKELAWRVNILNLSNPYDETVVVIPMLQLRVACRFQSRIKILEDVF